jgi:hypothetical protein
LNLPFLATAKVLARLILQLSPIIIDATRIAKGWKSKKDLPEEDLTSRLGRLEKNLELQSDLNEQFIAEMRVLKPALEGMHKSLKIVFSLALLACVLSLTALLVMFFK